MRVSITSGTTTSKHAMTPDSVHVSRSVMLVNISWCLRAELKLDVAYFEFGPETTLLLHC